MTTPAPGGMLRAGSDRELRAFVGRLAQRVQFYLNSRPDSDEQTDHLRHVADLTRWVYFSELQRLDPEARISQHDDLLIQACVAGHDIGKWVPRHELQGLVPADPAALTATFAELKFSPDQSQLFLLGVRRRLKLVEDSYTPEYDSAHHLVSIFLLATDTRLGFHRLPAADRARLITMIVGHQFGSYFKERLLNLSLNDGSEVTTGMLLDVSRPDRMLDDRLACAFHDADISDLLRVGSLERRPNREDVFHTGGLIKILMINFINLIFEAAYAPADFDGCLRSCMNTVNNATKEFITQTAADHALAWREEGKRFLERLRRPPVYDNINAILLNRGHPKGDRLTAARSLLRLQAREFLHGAVDLGGGA